MLRTFYRISLSLLLSFPGNPLTYFDVTFRCSTFSVVSNQRLDYYAILMKIFLALPETY